MLRLTQSVRNSETHTSPLIRKGIISTQRPCGKATAPLPPIIKSSINLERDQHGCRQFSGGETATTLTPFPLFFFINLFNACLTWRYIRDAQRGRTIRCTADQSRHTGPWAPVAFPGQCRMTQAANFPRQRCVAGNRFRLCCSMSSWMHVDDLSMPLGCPWLVVGIDQPGTM